MHWLNKHGANLLYCKAVHQRKATGSLPTEATQVHLQSAEAVAQPTPSGRNHTVNGHACCRPAASGGCASATDALRPTRRVYSTSAASAATTINRPPAMYNAWTSCAIAGHWPAVQTGGWTYRHLCLIYHTSSLIPGLVVFGMCMLRWRLEPAGRPLRMGKDSDAV